MEEEKLKTRTGKYFDTATNSQMVAGWV